MSCTETKTKQAKKIGFVYLNLDKGIKLIGLWD